VAAALRRELHIEPEIVQGRYGEFTVLVDGEEVVNGGALALLGILPSASEVRAAIERKMWDT
jgi:hypothetical protein